MLLRRVATLGAAGVIGQIITVVALLVLTRLYNPADFAVWSVLTSVSVLFSGIATLRYELAIVLPERVEDAAALLLAAVGCSFCIAALAAVIQTVIGPWLVGSAYAADIRQWWWFIPGLVLATGTVQATSLWCTREKLFRWYAFGQIGLPAMTAAGQIGAWYLGWRGPIGLLAGSVLGQGAVAIGLSARVVIWEQRLLTALNRRNIWDAVVRFRQYPRYMVPYTLTGSIRERVVYFLMATFAAKEDVGLYGVAARFVNMPSSLFSNALRPVFFSRAARTRFADLQPFVLAILRLLVIVVVPAWVAFVMYAPDLMELALGGPQWRGAGPYAIVLSVPAVFLMISNWLDRSFDVLGRQRLAFLTELAFSILSVAGLMLGRFLLDSIFAGIVIQSGLLTIGYIGWLMVIFRVGGFRGAGLRRLLQLMLTFFVSCWLLLVAVNTFLPRLGAIVLFLTIAYTVAASLGHREWDAIRAESQTP